MFDESPPLRSLHLLRLTATTAHRMPKLSSSQRFFSPHYIYRIPVSGRCAAHLHSSFLHILEKQAYIAHVEVVRRTQRAACLDRDSFKTRLKNDAHCPLIASMLIKNLQNEQLP